MFVYLSQSVLLLPLISFAVKVDLLWFLILLFLSYLQLRIKSSLAFNSDVLNSMISYFKLNYGIQGLFELSFVSYLSFLSSFSSSERAIRMSEHLGISLYSPMKYLTAEMVLLKVTKLSMFVWTNSDLISAEMMGNSYLILCFASRITTPDVFSNRQSIWYKFQHSTYFLMG